MQVEKIIILTMFPNDDMVYVLAENLITKKVFCDSAYPKDKVLVKVNELMEEL